MSIYKIDSIHRHVILEGGGQRTSHPHTQHEFDIPNNHSYNEKGELIKERELGKMDIDFCIKLAGISPIERVEDFLDYQFQHTKDKLKFFKHINTGAIINSYKIKQTPSRQTILIDWLQKKKKQLEQPIFSTFEELYNYAYNRGLYFEDTTKSSTYVVALTINVKNYLFNTWLNEKFGYEAGDDNYKEFLTINNYKEFLKSYIKEMKDEKSKWQEVVRNNRIEIGLENEKSGGGELVKPGAEKIKWLGSPEQFGYLFGELVSKGYIELPTRQTEGSISKLAELCLNYFEIPVGKGQTKGKQTTIENLKRALNPNKNTLSAKGKATIKLPQLEDLK